MNWEVLILLILFIPIFLLIRWILNILNFKEKVYRKYIALISSFILTPLLYIGLLTIWGFSISYYPQKTFDKKEWQEKTEERYKMSSDIIKSEILIGMSKEEVTDLLGNDFNSYNNGNNITYELGFVPRLLNIDPDVLDISFEGGKVVKVIQRGT
jgi:hypothetical protein